MVPLHLLLVVAAAICFGLAAAGIPSRIGLGWLGLLCWVLTELIAGAR